MHNSKLHAEKYDLNFEENKKRVRRERIEKGECWRGRKLRRESIKRGRKLWRERIKDFEEGECWRGRKLWRERMEEGENWGGRELRRERIEEGENWGGRELRGRELLGRELRGRELLGHPWWHIILTEIVPRLENEWGRISDPLENESTLDERETKEKRLDCMSYCLSVPIKWL